VQPFVRVRIETEAQTSVTSSKLGGNPYLPSGATYPTDVEGQPLFLLAQINCSDLPDLGGTSLSDLPTQGILQFYIADDDLYGLDPEQPNTPDYFQVLYHPEVDAKNCVKDFSFLPYFDDMPLDGVYALSFARAEAPVSLQDVRFDQTFNESPYVFFDQFGPDAVEVKGAYARLSQAGGHKMGGYAHFTQEDPRFEQKEYEGAVLLLQIDSDDDRVNWGDRGVANFFILPEHLKNQDFSRVLYNWDTP
jgi:uncharacterized protein YwqG